MVSIAQAKQEIARAQLEATKRRAELQTQQKQLESQQKSVRTQSALRGKGMSAMVQRKQVEVGVQKGQIEIVGLRKELTGYEQQLAKASKEIAQAEAEQSRHKRTYEQAKSLAGKGESGAFAVAMSKDPLLRKYYQQIKSQSRSASDVREYAQAVKDYKEAQIGLKDFEKKYPSEKLIRNKQGEVMGVESGALGMSMHVEGYNKKIEKLQRVAEAKRQSVRKFQKVTGVSKMAALSIGVSKYVPTTIDKLKTFQRGVWEKVDVKLSKGIPSKVKRFLTDRGEKEYYSPPTKVTIGGGQETKFEVPRGSILNVAAAPGEMAQEGGIISRKVTEIGLTKAGASKKVVKWGGFGAGVTGTIVGYGALSVVPGGSALVSTTMVAGGTKTMIDKTKSPFSRTLGLVEAGIGGRVGYKVGKKYLKETITKYEVIRPTKTPKGKEVKWTKIKGDKTTKLSSYKVKGEYTPSIRKIETTRFREILKLKPKKETIIKPRKFSVKTIGAAEDKKPFLVMETIEGRKWGTIYEMRGAQVPRNLRQLRQLPKAERLAWQRMAEARTGRPVSLKSVPLVLEKETSKIGGVVLQRRIGRLNLRTKTLTVKPYDMKVTAKATATEIKTLKQVGDIKVSKAESYFKDITKTQETRMVGETPKIKTTILEYQKPIVSKDKGFEIIIKRDSGVTITDSNIIYPKAIKKTPFDTTIQKQTTKFVQELPKPTAPKPSRLYPTTKVVKTKPTTQLLKTFVGAKSIYAGKGMYELTNISGTGLTQGLKLGMGTKQLPTQKIKVKQLQKLKQIIKLKQKPQVKQFQGVKSVQGVQSKVKLGLKQKMKVKQVQKLQQLQKISQTSQVTKTPTPIKPKPKIIIKPKISESIVSKSGKTKITKQGDLYKVYSRRYGEWIKVGTAINLQQAKTIGKRYVETTLGVSVRVAKEGKLQKLGDMGFGFRPSKKEKFTAIQKRKFRLGTKSEVKEIQMFARKKTKKKTKKKKAKKMFKF